MAADLRLTIAPLAAPEKGVAVIFADADLATGPVGSAFMAKTPGLLRRAAEADGFKGKHLSALDIIAPAGLPVARLLVVGLGRKEDVGTTDWVKTGGFVMG